MTDDWHYTADLLVKPTLSPKEEEGEEPFRTLIDNFSEKLMNIDVCIIIGFSLRDRRITHPSRISNPRKKTDPSII
jgi:hypothetical protein